MVFRTRSKIKFITFNAAKDNFCKLEEYVNTYDGGVVIVYDVYNLKKDATVGSVSGSAHSVMLRKDPSGQVYFFDINGMSVYDKKYKGALLLNVLLETYVNKIDFCDVAPDLHEELCKYAESRSSDPLGACSFYCEGAQLLW